MKQGNSLLAYNKSIQIFLVQKEDIPVFRLQDFQRIVGLGSKG